MYAPRSCGASGGVTSRPLRTELILVRVYLWCKIALKHESKMLSGYLVIISFTAFISFVIFTSVFISIIESIVVLDFFFLVDYRAIKHVLKHFSSLFSHYLIPSIHIIRYIQYPYIHFTHLISSYSYQ